MSDTNSPDCDRTRVQRAFALGWHMAELYQFRQVSRIGADPEHSPLPQQARPVEGGTRPNAHMDPPGVPAQPVQAVPPDPPETMPGLGEFDDERRRTMLINQVRNDIHAVWSQSLGAPAAVELDAQIVALEDVHDQEVLQQKLLPIHKELLSGLTITDFRLGKSYGLGRALGDTTIVPCARAGARGEGHETFEAALEYALGYWRVFRLQSWLHDLRDCFPEHAADAVATTLAGWSLWQVRPTIGDRHRVDWSSDRDVGRIERAMRRQADVWRGLLSGEKNPLQMLSANYYFAAMASVLRKVAGLAWTFIGTTIGLVLVLIVLVAAIALYFAATSSSAAGILASIVALLSSLGITTGGAWSSAKQALSQAEKPLWEAEVGAAVGHAAWHNPAPLGSIENIQLMLTVGEKPDHATATRVRHPTLTALRNVPVGRIGVILIVVSIAVGLFAADAARLQRDAAFFLPSLCIVGFLALIDGWDLLIGLSARQVAPFLTLPERIELPGWVAPVAQYLTPAFLLIGLFAGHFFWH